MSDTLDSAAAIVKQFEGLELEAYPDPGSPLGKACIAQHLPMREYRKVNGWERLNASPWTIGYGHTGPEVIQGKAITASEADSLLRGDLGEAAGDVMRLVKAELTDNQRSALISFCFNEGCGNLARSTLLKLLNAGAPRLQAADEFPRWDKSGGEELEGLHRRREAERALFLA